MHDWMRSRQDGTSLFELLQEQFDEMTLEEGDFEEEDRDNMTYTITHHKVGKRGIAMEIELTG